MDLEEVLGCGKAVSHVTILAEDGLADLCNPGMDLQQRKQKNEINLRIRSGRKTARGTPVTGVLSKMQHEMIAYSFLEVMHGQRQGQY